MPRLGIRESRPATRFVLLAALLILIFFVGGSSRTDVQSLQILRPIAILIGAYALFSLGKEQWREYRHPLILLGAVIALIASHLLPLPPEVWQHLPGRQLVVDIDALAGLKGNWRPLSMVPAATLNALYAMSIPVSIFCLAAQLDQNDHIRLLLLLIVLAIISGTLGLLQAIGMHIQLYDLSSENGGLFANRNHQGLLLALLFPMLAVASSLGGVLGIRSKLMTIVACALALITVPLIIVTGSRAGLMASAVAVLLIPLIGLRRPGAVRPRNWKKSAGVAAVVAVVIGGLVWLTIFASRETALTRFEATEGDIRLPVWKSIVEMLPSYLPWGSGIGSYADVYQILEPDVLLRPTFSNHAHNEWLEIVLTAGLPGVVLIAWAIALFLYAAWRAFGASGIGGSLSRLGLGMLLLLALGSTLDYPVRTPAMSSVLAIAAVWASSFRKFRNEDGRG